MGADGGGNYVRAGVCNTADVRFCAGFVFDSVSCEILNLSRNKITSLPSSILSLKNLKELYLSENDLNLNSEFINELELTGMHVFL